MRRRPTLIGIDRGTVTTSIGAGLSTIDDGAEAARTAARHARPGGPTDLAFLFLSQEHLDEAEDAAAAVREELAPRHLVACVAQGIVGGAREVEEGPAAAVWAASLPGARVDAFHVSAYRDDDEIVFSGVPQLRDPAVITLLVDPFTFPADRFLDVFGSEHRGVPVVGGVAAGGGAPGLQALIVDDEVHTDGAVAAAISGVPVSTLVSQGCAPIGRDVVITAAEDNVVYELAGKAAMEKLREEVAMGDAYERRQAANGLMVGLVVDENKPDYGRGDYLMRGLLGADGDTGAIAVGAPVRVGQTLRFHIRDAASADSDLRDALAEVEAQPAGALLFTCNGRGTRMFPMDDHDARAINVRLGPLPLAGFFCGGEIGPVGDRAYVHGFTATIALFFDR